MNDVDNPDPIWVTIATMILLVMIVITVYLYFHDWDLNSLFYSEEIVNDSLEYGETEKISMENYTMMFWHKGSFFAIRYNGTETGYWVNQTTVSYYEFHRILGVEHNIHLRTK